MRSKSIFLRAKAKLGLRVMGMLACILLLHAIPAQARAQATLPEVPAPQAPREKKPSRPLPEDANFKPTRTKPVVSPFFFYGVGGTATLGALVFGIVYNYHANNAALDTKNLYTVIEAYRINYTDRQTMCKQPILDKLCKEQDQRIADWNTYRKLAIGGYAVAGVVALGTGIGSMLVHRWPGRLTKNKYKHRDTLSSFEMTPILAPTQQGLQFKVAF